VAGICLLLVIFLSLWLISKINANQSQRPVNNGDQNSSSSLATLTPQGGLVNRDDKSVMSKNEELAFGSYYQSLAATTEIKAKGVALPTNIKELTANYYAFNREINLTQAQLNQINQNGFVVIDNPFPKEASDFYALYKAVSYTHLTLPTIYSV